MTKNLYDVHPDAKIGKNVSIGSFSTIYGDVEIGDNTQIGSNVTIMDGARIGKGCKIFPGAVVSAKPQDLKFKNEYTIAHIGDNTTIRECVTINKGTAHRNKTIVGSGVLLMAYCHIAHDCIVEDNVIMGNGVQLGGHVIIREHALIGGLSAVQQFLEVGKHVMIAGMSGIGKDVPPFVRASRNPLAYIGVNSIGLRRREFKSDVIDEISHIYRKIFVDGYSMSKALSIIKDEFPQTSHRDDIVNFITNSEKGIIRKFFDSNQQA